MGESTGRIVFINSHDYVSDVTGTPAIGCLASLRSDDGSEVILYTASLRLQHTLEMAFATKTRVTVDYFDADASPAEQRGREPSSRFPGSFNLKAMWTLE
jgi:hypothetical protein